MLKKKREISDHKRERRKDWEQGCIDFNWTRRDKIQKKKFFFVFGGGGGMAQHIGRPVKGPLYEGGSSIESERGRLPENERYVQTIT